MRWHDVELQNLDMSKRSGRRQTGNARDCGMCADVDDYLAADQHALATVVQGNFDRSRRDETPASHDELGTAGLIGIEVEGDVAVDHVLFAPPNLRQVGRDWTGHCAELIGVAAKVCDACAPDLVLAGQAGDGGTGAADPATLNHRNALPRSGQMPGEQLATLSAA